MYVQVRLYAKHDLDLLAYAALPFVKLDDLMHTCVCAYVRNKPLTLPFQVDLSNGINIQDQRICVTFNEEEDADVIAWLKNTRYGYQNAIIKMVTRSYFPQSIIEDAYIIHDGVPNTPPVNPPKQVRPSKKASPNKAAKNISQNVTVMYPEPVAANNLNSIIPEQPINNIKDEQLNHEVNHDPPPENLIRKDEGEMPSYNHSVEDSGENDDTFDMFESIGDSLMV